MRDAADMPELEKDDAALGVHGVDNLAPARDLRLRIDAGRRWISPAVREHGRGLRAEQGALGGALAVIFGVERPRRKALALGPHARQRRHRDAMRERVRTDLQRLKQRLEFHAGLEWRRKDAHHIARGGYREKAPPLQKQIFPPAE